MKGLIIFGSRTLNDKVVREYCQENCIPLKLHFLNRKYGCGMYHHRSKAILEEGDHCILIHDGKSRGTQNELELAKKMGVPTSYHYLEIISKWPEGDIFGH